MSRDLTNLYIDETFQYLTQISGSNQDILLDGVGNRITELDITASNAVSSSYALTASYALNSVPQVSASYATSASYALNADNSISASYSVTAVSSSFANVSISASYSNVADTSISSSYALTASYAESAIAENVTFDDTNFAYTASNVQIALQRLSDNKADISQLTSNVTTFPTTAAADIGGYFALVTSSVDARYNTTAVDVPTGGITTTGQLVASLVTDSYLFLGNPGIVNLNTNGQIRKVAGSGEATFYYEVYSRSGSVETLLTTSDNTPPVESTVYSEFSAAAILNDGTFTSDDRIVLKFYANRVPGGSNPSYQFQFGGDTPVRTLFPVPATVLVSPWNGQFTGDAGITGSLTVTEGITGSLNGNADTATSASYALTASYALNAGGGVTSIIAGTGISVDQSTGDVTITNTGGGGAAFPYTGSALITGSLQVIGQTRVDGGFIQNLLDTGSQNFKVEAPGVGNLRIGISGFNSPGGWKSSANLNFNGTDTAFFSAENDFYIQNIYSGTGSINITSENKLPLTGKTGVDITSATGNINITPDPTKSTNINGSAIISGSLEVIGATSLMTNVSQGQLFSVEDVTTPGNFQVRLASGVEDQVRMDFNDTDTGYISSQGNLSFNTTFDPRQPGGIGTGSMTFITNNSVEFRTPNYGRSGTGNINFIADQGTINLETLGNLDLSGKAFATSIASNINGFSNEVNQDTFVRDNQRAFVETPLLVAPGATITVGTNSTLKVINEL